MAFFGSKKSIWSVKSSIMEKDNHIPSPTWNTKHISTWTNVVNDSPDYSRFEIKRIRQIGKNVVAKIKFPECKTYKGMKILVFINISVNKIQQLHKIDPHFRRKKTAPFARFKPTKKGWEMAILLAKKHV